MLFNSVYKAIEVSNKKMYIQQNNNSTNLWTWDGVITLRSVHKQLYLPVSIAIFHEFIMSSVSTQHDTTVTTEFFQ